MTRLLAFCLCFFACAATAQQTADAEQEERDRGFLTGLIEDNLSGVSRDVTIVGFDGALSSRATIEVLTIADAEGVWLRMEDLTLDWDRSALFRGRIEVRELTAGLIALARAPVSEAEAPTPEATPFSLPELPVAIDIDTLRADRIVLGEPLLGEEVALTLAGSVALEGGEGTARIVAERIDGGTGRFEIAGSYSNDTEVLALEVALAEGENGIVARLLDLPGRPSVALTLEGTAPVDDYSATLSLATDGEERIAGSFGIETTEPPQDAPDAPPALRFALDVGGDVTPLVAPQFRDFFGTEVDLTVAGARGPDGALRLDELLIDTRSLTLAGSAEIGADGWPERLQIEGRIGGEDGTPVLLPLAGGETTVRAATLDVGFDAATGDRWTGRFAIEDLARPGLAIPDLTLAGGGVIRPVGGAGPGIFTAALDYAARGLVLQDAALAEALGAEIAGEIALEKRAGEPFEITALTLTGPGIKAEATATIEGAETGFRTRSAIDLRAPDISRFSALAGQDLGGAADVTVESTVAPLDGAFELRLAGTTRDLSVGIDALDPLLAGTGEIALAATRDEAGTRIETLDIATPALTGSASADITSGESSAAFDLRIADAGLIQPDLSGPVALAGTARRDADGQSVAAFTAEAPGARATVAATLAPADQGGAITAEVAAEIEDLSPYAALAGRPLSGGLSAEVSGTLQPDLSLFNLEVAARSEDLAVGIDPVDALLAGEGRLSGRVIREGPESFAVEDLAVLTPGVSLVASGALDEGVGEADFDLRIAEAEVLAPALDGPLAVSGSARRTAEGAVVLDVDAAGPAGAAATIDGTLAPPEEGYAFDGRIALAAEDLSPYGPLVGRDLSGAVEARLTGTAMPDGSRFALDLEVATRGLGIGNPTADRLLAGAGTLAGRAVRDGDALRIEGLRADFPAFDVSGELTAEGNAGEARFDARLADIGLFAPDFSGPATATGTATLGADGNWRIDTVATGPGGITLDVEGAIGSGGTLDLDIDGSAPLGLLNGFIEPRRIAGTATLDLALQGPPALSSLSGTISTADARLAAPTLGQALEGIAGTVTLAGGRATLDLAGSVPEGGGVRVAGPVGLSAPFPADLSITLDDVALRDPELYETTAEGTITVTGPLAGGAVIGGTVTLGTTEIRVPSTGVGPLGELPEVAHVAPPPAVRRTLDRAGITQEGGRVAEAGGDGGPVFPLDLRIEAPSRVFIRGRGLDAEFGGALRLTGTTRDVVPLGQFDLIRGRLDILQQRFELTEGSVSLQGEFVPYVRLVATTTAETGTLVNIVLEGPVTSPEVRFESSPDLPQDEILAQLIFGRDLSAITPLQAVQLASAAGTLAGRGGGLMDDLRSGFGLDDLDIAPDEEGNLGVRAGKYLSENVYTDVTIGADTTEINLNLDLTDNITVKGSTGTDGDASLGIFYQRDY